MNTTEFENLVKKLLYYLDRDSSVSKLNYHTIDAINELEEFLLKLEDDNK